MIFEEKERKLINVISVLVLLFLLLLFYLLLLPPHLCFVSIA
jgi:hypothetical protein